jgi:chorismate mutase
MLERNDVDHDDVISIVFTATEDLTSMFPATAARTVGLGDVPLLCARELSIDGGTPRCVRVLVHLTTERPRSELRHVYLEGAKGLRDDLPG